MEQISRNITLYGDITSEKIEEVIQKLSEINDYDNRLLEELKDYEPEVVRLLICSGGGELFPAMGLCEFMKYSTTPIATICLGEAMSAAFLILICGHVRLASRGSSMMIHQLKGGCAGSTKNCIISHAEMERADQNIIDLIKENTEMELEDIEEMYLQQIDRYFSVDEALELKIIDKVYGDSDEQIEESETIQ